MGDRFPGGVISKTPPTVTPPVDGEGGSASGVWSLAEQLELQKAGNWPQKVLPRELYAWGSNFAGALGDNTTVSKSSPVQIGPNLAWAQVSAGPDGQTVAVTTTSRLYAWGANGRGQLGDGTTINRSSPVQIGALTSWVQVSAGSGHTAAIRTDGTLWLWGYNRNGQLGLNVSGNNYNFNAENRSSPTQIGALSNWVQVKAGAQHTAAVKTDGTLWTWGSNSSGQLGIGVSGQGSAAQNRSSPVQVGSLTNWAQVAAGNIHTAALTTGGALFTWGSGQYGRTGHNSSESYYSPKQVGSLTNWAQVSAANRHTTAIKTGGTLWAFGRNNYGELGDGTVVNRSSPVQIGALTNWSQVSGKSTSTAAVKTDGTLWSWGNGGGGVLGDGTTIRRSSPVQIGALTNWVEVSVAYHTLARTTG